MNCSDNAEVSVGERRWERQSEDGNGGRERESEEGLRSFYINKVIRTEKQMNMDANIAGF